MSEVASIMSYFIMPRVTPLYYHYSNEPSICDAFDNSHVQYISDTLLIIWPVFKPQFIHCTKYAKYAFLLLFSICNMTSSSNSFKHSSYKTRAVSCGKNFSFPDFTCNNERTSGIFVP